MASGVGCGVWGLGFGVVGCLAGYQGRLASLALQSHVETHIIDKLDFNQNYYTFAVTLLIKIVLCSKFH